MAYINGKNVLFSPQVFISGGGGGASLNIAYGETPPEDTSKLWVKANEPTNVSVGSDVEGVESIKIISNLPTTYPVFGSAMVGTKIYLIGGKDQNNNKLNTINVFDTETETITTLDTTLPTGHCDMGCVSVGSKIYLFGGIVDGGRYTRDIRIFDTETNTIRISTATFPSTYSYMSCVAKGNKIYLFGGYYYDGLSYYKNTISVFDIGTETFSTLPITLPISCHNMGSAIVGTKIYLIGGMSKDGILNTINVFDTETETITTLDTTLPTTLHSMGCSVIGTKIYLFGGIYERWNGYETNTINVIDTETETITTLDTTLPIVSSSMGTVTNGNKIYLFVGTNDESRIKVFTLTHELANGDIELQSGLLKNKFKLINTENAQVEIGVENVYIGNANNEAETANAYLFVDGEWKQISFGTETIVTRASISVTTAGELIGEFVSANSVYLSVSKSWDGFAVAGYYTYGENLVGAILAGCETEQATHMTGVNGDNTSAMTYNEATVYYNFHPDILNGEAPAKNVLDEGKAHYLGHYDTLPEDMSTIATELLDYYYSLDE